MVVVRVSLVKEVFGVFGVCEDAHALEKPLKFDLVDYTVSVFVYLAKLCVEFAQKSLVLAKLEVENHALEVIKK